MRNRWWGSTAFAAAALAAVAACGSSGSGSSGGSTPSTGSSSSSTPASTTASNTVKTATIGSATVLTNSKGFTLYTFALDTTSASKCNGQCAHYWPPVKGPVTGSGISGTLGTTMRSDGTVQATYNGHPRYTYIGDTAPGQNKGNGLNLSGGIWKEVVLSGTAPGGGGEGG